MANCTQTCKQGLRPGRYAFTLLAIAIIWIFTAKNLYAADNSVLSLPQQDNADPVVERIHLLEALVNGVQSGTWIFIERDGALYAPQDAFDAWRLTPKPGSEEITFREERFYPLTAIPGFEMSLDFAEQSMRLQFSPEEFATTRLEREVINKPELNPVLPSLFINYDFNYTLQYKNNTPTPKNLSTLTEVGFSSDLGVITSSYVGRNLTDNKAAVLKRSFTRLETTFTHNFADKNRTLRIGDTYTKSTMLGRSVYYGGISYGTNFELTPGFISQPLPAITGLSSAPSTVELYINDVLRQVSTVPTGPFSLDNVPAITASSNARLVVRDQLGRETIIEQSLLTNSQLLAKDLNDWSVEAGFVRNQLGTTKENYAEKFVGGFWRRGFTNSTTIEGHAALSGKQFNFGVGGLWALPFHLLGRVAVSSSNHDQVRAGEQFLLGLEYQNLYSNAVFEIQSATRNYRQLGQSIEVKSPKFQLASSWSYGTEKYGAFTLGFVKLRTYDKKSITTMTASYSRRIGRQSNLSLVASRADNKIKVNSTITLNLIIPLGKGRTTSSHAGYRRGSYDIYQTVSKNASIDNNLSWRALAGYRQNKARAEAGAFYSGRYGTLNGELNNSNKQTSVRLGLTSSLIYTHQTLFATRRLEESFAVAEIEGYEDIGIGLGSNVLARTNARGIALIPRLTPFQNNFIRIDPRELPISASIDSIEQVVVPSYRSAVMVTFPVRTGRGALLRIIFDDDEVAPPGAIVGIEGDTETFYLARRGEAFVTGLQSQNQLVLNWKNQQCKFEVMLPEQESDDIPRLGPFLCQGITR